MSQSTPRYCHALPACGGVATCSVCQEEARLGRCLTEEEGVAILALVDVDERRAKEGRLLALCGELRLGVQVVERLCERIEWEAARHVTEIGPPAEGER